MQVHKNLNLKERERERERWGSRRMMLMSRLSSGMLSEYWGTLISLAVTIGFYVDYMNRIEN